MSWNRARRGMTLLELMIAVGIAAIITSAAYLLMSRGQLIERRINEETAAVHAVRVQVRRMTDEIQEGTRLVHPLSGQDSSSGLVFVNARGETICYYVSDPASGPRSLWRECANEGEKSREIIVKNVVHFRATTAPASPGLATSLVKLDLDAGTSIPGVEANVVTAAFLGSLEKNIPEDSTAGPWPYPPASAE